MPPEEQVKDGICYMCSLSCPTRVHVKNGRATSVELVSRSVAKEYPQVLTSGARVQASVINDTACGH